MNALEFEEAVRELRRRQRRFFHCRKDDPDKDRLKLLMRDQEETLRSVIEPVMAVRPKGPAQSEREEFFLLAADMLRKQREWVQHRGEGWSMLAAIESEKRVDRMLEYWHTQRDEDNRRKMEAEKKKQLSLF